MMETIKETVKEEAKEEVKEQNPPGRTVQHFRTSFADNFKIFVARTLAERRKMKYLEKSRKALVNLTPKEMKSDVQQEYVDNYALDVKSLPAIPSAPISTISSIRGARTIMGGLKLTMSDILERIPSFKILYQHGAEDDLIRRRNQDQLSISSPISPNIKQNAAYITVKLRQTDTIVLYEHNSETVPKDSDEALVANYDNNVYDYLTIGNGRFRLLTNAEAQTNRRVTHNRGAGPKYSGSKDAAVNASSSEIYDVLHPENCTKSQINHSKGVDAYLHALAASENFSTAVMHIERALAKTFHAKSQMRYRDLHKRPEAASEASLTYEVNEIFRFAQPVFEITKIKKKVREAVSDISVCFGNTDLIAVGYGIFCHITGVVGKSGHVCVWNIKNPHNPERTYSYKNHVTAVSFSPFDHSLIAVGTANGWLEVRDISVQQKPPLAVIHESSILIEPIIAIKWRFRWHAAVMSYNKFLTLSLDATVRKFHFTKGPYLAGALLIQMNNVTDKIEGLPISDVPHSEKNYTAGCVSAGLNITLDPVNDDIYYMLTNQGCVVKCSITLTNTYLSMLDAHRGAVNCMEFSPWSPKIFLTCGNDWHIRIWMDSVTESLVSLTHNMMPVNIAAWSPIHSTTILALNRETLDIWDLRYRFKPMKSVEFDRSFNTLFKFSPSGSCIMVGNEKGDVITCALENIPSQMHFQYDMLEKVLYTAIENENVRHQFKEAGFFGYSNKAKQKINRKSTR